MKLKHAFILSLIGAGSLLACGPNASQGPAPQSAGGSTMAADAGLPPPKTSSRRGVIVPSDTGLGSNPSGSGQTTGTSGRSVGPTLGNPGGGN